MSYLFMLTFGTFFKRTIRFSRAIWFLQFLSRFQLLLQARVKGGGGRWGVGGDEKSSLVTFFKKST